jgi:SAM-dependent methyltransferase
LDPRKLLLPAFSDLTITADMDAGGQRATSSIYDMETEPQDWIKHITSLLNVPPTPSKPRYGLDSPMGLLASNIAAPLYLYASLKGKHDLWDSLLRKLPDGLFQGPALDMGCGRGMVLLKVAQRKKAISASDPAYGVDIFNTSDQSGNAPEATYANAACLGVLENIVLHTASFTEKFPFADGVFSLVTSSLAIHNVDAKGRNHAIEELVRVCRPGGRVLLVDLMGYPKEYADNLTALGWTDVSYGFAGVGSMFGMWPCQVVRANKPL